MNNGFFPINSFGFLFELPQIILSLNEINKQLINRYQQIQKNCEILFNLYENYKKDSNEVRHNNNKNINYNLFNQENQNKPYFKVANKVQIKKRMYQVDCMTKKLNVNFFKYLKENKKELCINKNILKFFKKNIKLTSRTILEQLKIKYPNIKDYFEKFLHSKVFIHLMNNIKQKNDDEYTNLFINHIKNHQKILNDNNEENVKKK